MMDINFACEVIRVQTMQDGAIRVILDLPEYAIEQMAMLVECKRQGLAINATLTPTSSKETEDNLVPDIPD